MRPILAGRQSSRRREVVRQARVEQEEAARTFRELAEALPDPEARALMLAKADELDLERELNDRRD